jgi:putative transposase
MGIKEVLIAPRSPWQNPFCERIIGSIRRECTDHVIIWNQEHLRRILLKYMDYYNGARPHSSLDGDSPVGREVETDTGGEVVAIPQVGGLHHRYTRAA